MRGCEHCSHARLAWQGKPSGMFRLKIAEKKLLALPLTVSYTIDKKRKNTHKLKNSDTEEHAVQWTNPPHATGKQPIAIYWIRNAFFNGLFTFPRKPYLVC